MYARRAATVLVSAVLLGCQADAPSEPGDGLQRSGRSANMSYCPYGDAEMPGGWCPEEYYHLQDIIGNIRGDASCDLMRTSLLGWLEGGLIYRAPDLSPGVGGIVNWNDNSEFENRFNYMQVNPNNLTDGHTILRHEYGHVHQNRTHAQGFYTERYEDACRVGGTGATSGGGLGDPWPPVY